MAARVRLGKCADIQNGASGVLGLLCRLLWFDLDLDLNEIRAAGTHQRFPKLDYNPIYTRI